MSETRLVHYNDGNVAKFSHYIKYKNRNYINIALYSIFFGNLSSKSTFLVLSKFSFTNS